MRKTAVKDGKVRKVLVRNAIVPARTRQVTEPEKHVHFTREEREEEEGASTSISEQNDLSTPEFCTVLKLADEISKIRLQPSAFFKKKSGKSPTPCNVDFEPDEKLFSNLVSLDIPNSELQPSGKLTSSYKSSCKRDPEPDYKELLKYSLQPEHNFISLCVPDVKRPVPEFDGRSIYRLTKRWECYDSELTS